MLRNYFTMALRSLSKNKLITFIHIFGLSTALSACILVFLFVQSELSYDKQHANYSKIYRVVHEVTMAGQADLSGKGAFLAAPYLKKDFPEIEHAARVYPIAEQTCWFNNQAFQFDDVHFVDEEFFEMFDYDFITGNAVSLKDAGTCIVSDITAKTLFGDVDKAIGNSIKFTKNHFKIVGVYKNQLHTSHLRSSIFLSIKSVDMNQRAEMEKHWLLLAAGNYIQFKNEEAILSFDKKIKQFHDTYIIPYLSASEDGEEAFKGDLKFILQPLSKIHLESDFKFDYAEVGNKTNVYIFSVVGLFILLIASFNYINLTTAKAFKRAKELAVRKTVGANKQQLLLQFFCESLLHVAIAFIFAVSICELCLPLFNELTGKSFSESFIIQPFFIATIFVGLLFVALLSSLYPAWYMAKIDPVVAFKSGYIPSSSQAIIKKALVVFQFSISIVLLICTGTVYTQMQYMKNKDVGFNKENVLVIKVPFADSSFVSKLDVIKQELLTINGVKKVAGTNHIPGDKMGGLIEYVNENGATQQYLMGLMAVDYDCLDLLNIQFTSGRNFSKAIKTDDTAAFILNESAIKLNGWKDVSKLEFSNYFNYKGKVVGVVKDFNFKSAHNQVEPLVIVLTNRVPGNLLIKLDGENTQEAVAKIENVWKKFSRIWPTEYFFLDDLFDSHYLKEEKILILFTYFSLLTVLIACLGLLGLVIFTTELKIKSIGIRKVLGASLVQLVSYVLKEFAILILLALVISWPIAFYVMNKWLENFAYHISPDWKIFVFAMLITILIAFVTVLFQSLKATMSNPVKILKYE
ncbi:MAG: FtsX-like permease family protein [Bacteroidota bacterium]